MTERPDRISQPIGQLLQSLQKGRPARSVYTVASIFAGIWLVGCVLLTVSFVGSLQAAIGQSGGVLVLSAPREDGFVALLKRLDTEVFHVVEAHGEVVPLPLEGRKLHVHVDWAHQAEHHAL